MDDASELLELVDQRGVPVGRGKERAAVHRDGDWHRTFHCWVLRHGVRGLEVMLQQRSLAKDTFPGYWDATVAGHWRFGEDAPMAAREVVEELGIEPPFDALQWVGREPTERHPTRALIDREVHEVYRLLWEAPLRSYHPDAREVVGLAAVTVADWLELLAGHIDAATATEAVRVQADGALAPVDVLLTRDMLVPYSQERARQLVHGLC